MTEAQAQAMLAARGLDTQAAALAARVGKDVVRWGEAERDASLRLHARQSHGLLIHSIAVFNIDAVDHELLAAAKAIMTAADDRVIYSGG